MRLELDYPARIAYIEVTQEESAILSKAYPSLTELNEVEHPEVEVRLVKLLALSKRRDEAQARPEFKLLEARLWDLNKLITSAGARHWVQFTEQQATRDGLPLTIFGIEARIS